MALKGKVLSFVVKEGKAPSAFIRRLGLSAANVIVGREKLPPWVREPLSWPQNDNTAKCCLAFTNSNTKHTDGDGIQDNSWQNCSNYYFIAICEFFGKKNYWSLKLNTSKRGIWMHLEFFWCGIVVDLSEIMRLVGMGINALLKPPNL